MGSLLLSMSITPARAPRLVKNPPAAKKESPMDAEHRSVTLPVLPLPAHGKKIEKLLAQAASPQNGEPVEPWVRKKN